MTDHGGKMTTSKILSFIDSIAETAAIVVGVVTLLFLSMQSPDWIWVPIFALAASAIHHLLEMKLGFASLEAWLRPRRTVLVIALKIAGYLLVVASVCITILTKPSPL